MIRLIEIINRATLSPDFVQEYYWKVRKMDDKEASSILFDHTGYDKHLHDLDPHQLKELYNDLKDIVKKYNLQIRINVNEIKNVIPLDAPANIIDDDGLFDDNKFISILLKYRDQFFPKLSEQQLVELAIIYIENEIDNIEDNDEDIEEIKKSSIRGIIQHFVGALESDGWQLKEIKNIGSVTPEIVFQLIRQKYAEKKSDAIVDISLLFEEYGYLDWSEEKKEHSHQIGGDREEKFLFLKELQQRGKLDEFWRKVKAV